MRPRSREKRNALQADMMVVPDRALCDWLRAYAKKHPKGVPVRVSQCPRGGWSVNHKKIQRLWREEGLRGSGRRRRKRVGSSTVDAPAATEANTVWAVNFQFNANEQGRAIKICSIVDEHPRECIGGLVERSLTADRLTDRKNEHNHTRPHSPLSYPTPTEHTQQCAHQIETNDSHNAQT